MLVLLQLKQLFDYEPLHVKQTLLQSKQNCEFK